MTIYMNFSIEIKNIVAVNKNPFLSDGFLFYTESSQYSDLMAKLNIICFFIFIRLLGGLGIKE